MLRKRFLFALAVVGCLSVVAVNPGCVSADQANALSSAAESSLAQADAQIADASAKLDALKADPTVDPATVAKAEEIVAKANAAKAKLAAALAAFNANRAADGSADVGTAIGTASTFIPPPWNILVASAGGLLAGLWRSGAIKRAAREIVESIEAVKKANPALADELAKEGNIAILNAGQGDLAKRIVDEAQGTVVKIPV